MRAENFCTSHICYWGWANCPNRERCEWAKEQRRQHKVAMSPLDSLREMTDRWRTTGDPEE